MRTKTLLFIIALSVSNFALAQVRPNLPIVLKKNTKYASFKAISKQKALQFKPQKQFTIPIQSANKDVVDVSNFAKYLAEEKKVFPERLINADCNFLPINYRNSQQEVGLFFPSPNFSNSIYPGAVYQFNTIKTQSPIPYTKFMNRNPMDLTMNIFDASIRDNPPVVISNFGYGTVSGETKNILSRYINGVTPADVVTDVILVESNEQMNSILGTAGSVDVGFKLNVPIPKIPVTVDLANKVSVSNTSTTTTTTENKKNTVILRFRQVFYVASMTAQQGAQFDVFKDIDKTQLEQDLVYVSSVSYGQMFYVVLTSEFTKEALYNAVMNKVSTETSLGVTGVGLPVGGAVTVGTSNLSTSEVTNILTSNKTEIKTFQYGGQAINMGTTIDQVLANLNAKIVVKFNAQNIGAPIGYTLNFAADHSPAWINTNVNYATTNCGIVSADRKYDVKLVLQNLSAVKVDDTDSDEDLFGSLSASVEAPGKNSNFPNMWKKNGESYDVKALSNEDGVTKAYKDIPTNINSIKTIVTNVSNEDLRKTKISLRGNLKDKEVIADRGYVCVECNGSPLIINLADYANQIETMQPGESKFIKQGNSDQFKLNFYENGNKNASHIRVNWKIEVIAK
ncbi:MAG: hypothetical protein EOO47_06720 [Flavobacterium sp.]|nr:MAG: hypothetical protein EOO47_06720 [Flavobacterium sp.]